MIWLGPCLNPWPLAPAPPGVCVSSPVLFTLYTNECKHVALLTITWLRVLTTRTQFSWVPCLTHQIQLYTNMRFRTLSSGVTNSSSTLNIKKTEEMVFDPKSMGDHSSVVIHDQNIAQVDSYRYLGIHNHNKLTCSVQVENISTRVQQRLHFLHRLRVFGVHLKVLLLFYHVVVERILRYGISAWFGNLSVQLKAQLTRLTRRAMKIMGVGQHPTLQAVFDETIIRPKINISDLTHVLHPEYQLLPSGGRFRVPQCRLNRIKNLLSPVYQSCKCFD